MSLNRRSQKNLKHLCRLSLKYFIRLSILFLIILILYLCYTSIYLIIRSISNPFRRKIISDPYMREKYTRLRNTTIDNQTNTIFQPIIPENYYPHLPIHMFTQNLTAMKNISKLILLGNGFFGDKKWGLGAIGTSPEHLMTQSSCPFLTGYCDMTTDLSLLSLADAVVYHIRDNIDINYANQYRQSNQRFVFALWESPIYTPDLKSYNRFFNWTMTYRFQSHIIASYYHTNSYIHKSNPYFQYMIDAYASRNLTLNYKSYDFRLSDEIFANKKLGTIAALISNCATNSRRLKIIAHLKRFINVNVYGQCGRRCPENVDCREFIAKNYYFFLSLENSLCTDYTTEKFFSTLVHPIVPIVYGRTDYSQYIPSSGYIDIKDFSSILQLVQYLNQTQHNRTKYLSYFTWKKDYVSGWSHLFTPFCDLCIRLHLDSTPNIIENIETWWKENTCEKPKNFILS